MPSEAAAWLHRVWRRRMLQFASKSKARALLLRFFLPSKQLAVMPWLYATGSLLWAFPLAPRRAPAVARSPTSHLLRRPAAALVGGWVGGWLDSWQAAAALHACTASANATPCDLPISRHVPPTPARLPACRADYVAEIKAALSLWDGTGTFVFTSSAGVYTVEDGSGRLGFGWVGGVRLLGSAEGARQQGDAALRCPAAAAGAA